jgi:hypothetical protein
MEAACEMKGNRGRYRSWAGAISDSVMPPGFCPYRPLVQRREDSNKAEVRRPQPDVRRNLYFLRTPAQ